MIRRKALTLLLATALIMSYYTQSGFTFAKNSSLKHPVTSPPTTKVKIEQWNFNFELPSRKWIIAGEQQEPVTSKFSYQCQRKVPPSTKTTFIPTITFVFEPVQANLSIARYSVAARMNHQKFIVEKTFTHQDGVMTLDNALGYLGKYKDPQNNEHTIVVIHALHEKTGLQVTMDVTSDQYPALKNELFFTVKSLAFIKEVTY